MSTPPFTVKAEYAYTSPEEDDLQFEEGQIITVESIEDEEWYYGSYVDAAGNKLTGIFPQNFVSPYTQSETATSGKTFMLRHLQSKQVNLKILSPSPLNP